MLSILPISNTARTTKKVNFILDADCSARYAPRWTRASGTVMTARTEAVDFFAFDNSYARLPDRFFARLRPTPVAAPRLVRLNKKLAWHLELDPGKLAAPEGVEILAGNRVPKRGEPLAMAYAGHQFGTFVPQLGDGRAILLGEVIDRDGVRRDIQLKGSGPTPLPRRAKASRAKPAENASAALHLSVTEVMTRDVSTCDASDSIGSVLKRMTKGKFRHMPVLENDRLVGLVSIGDIGKCHMGILLDHARDLDECIDQISLMKL
jgi:hypothetical protein